MFGLEVFLLLENIMYFDFSSEKEKPDFFLFVTIICALLDCVLFYLFEAFML